MELIQEAPGKVSLTTDIWTSPKSNKAEFMAVTAHFIDRDWKLRHFILSFMAFPGRHRGKDIARKLIKVCTEFGILYKVVDGKKVKHNIIQTYTSTTKTNINKPTCYQQNTYCCNCVVHFFYNFINNYNNNNNNNDDSNNNNDDNNKNNNKNDNNKNNNNNDKYINININNNRLNMIKNDIHIHTYIYIYT